MADTYIIRADANNSPISDGQGNYTCDVHFGVCCLMTLRLQCRRST